MQGGSCASFKSARNEQQQGPHALITGSRKEGSRGVRASLVRRDALCAPEVQGLKQGAAHQRQQGKDDQKEPNAEHIGGLPRGELAESKW